MDTQQHYTPHKKLSIWKHLLVVWGGGIIVWPLLTALATSALLPSGEAFVFTLIVFLLNIFGGWAVALLAFLFHWGIRGWIETARQFNAARNEQAQYGLLGEEEMLAQWQQMNHIGCCMNHRDSAGYPSHGGPGCQHPGILEAPEQGIS